MFKSHIFAVAKFDEPHQRAPVLKSVRGSVAHIELSAFSHMTAAMGSVAGRKFQISHVTWEQEGGGARKPSWQDAIDFLRGKKAYHFGIDGALLVCMDFRELLPKGFFYGSLRDPEGASPMIARGEWQIPGLRARARGGYDIGVTTNKIFYADSAFLCFECVE